MKISLKKIAGNTKQIFINKRNKLPTQPLHGSQSDVRKKVNNLFRVRDKIFFKKKKAVSEAYPFTVIDPFDVFGEENLFGDFNLVGDNWRDKTSEKPVAILWGFNNWKWGFVSDYLPEYRTAFAPRKILSLQSLIALKRFPLKPTAFIFWGYTEPSSVKHYARLNNIKIYRMEDGFLRSSSLGASHSTPYSLVMDEKGLHYNPEEPSDLEDILNSHQFKEEEITSAEACLKLMRDLSLSKYNPPSLINGNQRNIKIRKRVAVLGQVDNDMSMRLGNPDGWTMIEMIRLAKLENPDAEILYRPHPDIYHGYQQSRFKKRAVEKICEVVSPVVSLIDFIDTVDHVYTVTSLSGLEALLRGKKVTVLGAAFYAGWGLTDDRVAFPRRTKKRTLQELFAAVYLKYPRYLADLSDSVTGFQAACLRICADREVGLFDLYSEQRADSAESVRILAKSPFWPMLIFKKKDAGNRELVQKALTQIDLDTLLAEHSGLMFQTTLMYALCGACESNMVRETVITLARERLDARVLNRLLLDLSRMYPGEYIARQFAWLLAQANENSISLRVLQEELMRSREASLRMVQAATETQDNTSDEEPSLRPASALTEEQAALLLDMFEQNINMCRIDDAIEIGKRLLLGGLFVTQIIYKMARLAVIRFDTDSARSLASLSQHIDQYSHNRMAALVAANNHTEQSIVTDRNAFVQTLAKLVVLKPDRITDATFMAKRFENLVDAEILEKLLIRLLFLDNEQSIRKAAGFVAIERADLAVPILERLIATGDHSDNMYVAYSQALSYVGRLDDALAVMRDARRVSKSNVVYRESLRLCTLGGMYKESLRLLKQAIAGGIELGDMHPRKVYFGNRMVNEAFKTFTEFWLNKTVATYYVDKYLHDPADAGVDDKILALAIFGPGDEIRFASIYNLLPQKFPQGSLSISCDPRLVKLFSRSFPNVTFVPVARPRNSDQIKLENYTRVPGSDLTGVIDNTAVDAIAECDRLLMVTDMLHRCLPDYDAFPGSAYLKHDSALSRAFSRQLPAHTKLVGLSWRSSVTTHSRNEHYLTVEELEPIFSIEGIQFVNFQYDECDEELAWVEQRYPGKLLNIREVDHYNDFDSVASLMKCMDIIIAPATTVVELAGSLGCPTWLLSNSSELHWRKINACGTDVWHRSVTHVEGDVLGDKSTLVAALRGKLVDFAERPPIVPAVPMFEAAVAEI